MKFITSPYLFMHANFNNFTFIDINSNEAYFDISMTVFDIIVFFTTPKTKKQARSEGYRQQDIDDCINFSFLISYTYYERVSSLWEKHNWQRAAFLSQTQQNLKYSENIKDNSKIEDLTNFRRKLLVKYNNEFPYPKQLFVELSPEIQLNNPTEIINCDFNSIAKRKCVRNFSKNGLSYEKFISILYNSTKTIREIEKTKNDIFYFLNSFYSWLNIFLVIQKVENIESGYYQYNPFKHSLLKIDNQLKNKDVLKCVQGQYWVGGSGFCLFFVVQWERYQWLYRHSRAYINLLIQLGDIGQEFLFYSCLNQVSGWMTPAVNESQVAKILKLNSKKQTAMYFMKLGIEK